MPKRRDYQIVNSTRIISKPRQTFHQNYIGPSPKSLALSCTPVFAFSSELCRLTDSPRGGTRSTELATKYLVRLTCETEAGVVVKVVIPAFNEENSVGKVVRAIPKQLVNEVIVVNNCSTDDTEQAAREAGATVLREPKKGYGRACLHGLEYLKSAPPDVVVFLDADYSDYPEEMSLLIDPILRDEADLVIGSRALGKRERGSMTPQQVFGNWLATFLLQKFYGVRFTDLGPFRAIRYSSLLALHMHDPTYGWTVEMQLKAAKKKLRCTEVPVRYRKRIGISKVSGTVKGTVLAGYKILYTIFKYARA
jgi:glycosyltransferase involved in cell wall biosynthesis